MRRKSPKSRMPSPLRERDRVRVKKRNNTNSIDQVSVSFFSKVHSMEAAMKDYVGFGALSEALQDLEKQNPKRVLIVASDGGWQRFTAKGEYDFFKNRESCCFTAFSPNPDFSEIVEGVETMREFDPDLLIAIGGGSAIDVAKMMKSVLFTKEQYDPGRPETVKPSGDGPPLVAIATTAGSGAEATQYAIFYVGTMKQSLASPLVRPEMAVVDPEMTYSLPPAITAATGFDALTQGVEAFWASSTTPQAQEYATASIRYALNNMYNAVHTPNPGNRYHMAQAAYLSGLALNITRTTIPHALGYHLTKFYGVPHGHAVALTVPYCFRLSLDPALPVNTPVGREGHVENMRKLTTLLGQETSEDCFVFWRNLLAACGLAPTLQDVGVDSEDKVRALVGSMNMARMKNHPVDIPAEMLIQEFLKEIKTSKRGDGR